MTATKKTRVAAKKTGAPRTKRARVAGTERRAAPKAAKRAKPAATGRASAPKAAKRAKPAAAGSASAPREASPAKTARGAPKTLAEFMTQALTMEIEAAQRYTEFADAMEIHNNREVAALFRKMADIETRHAQQIMAQMRWSAMPPPITPSWNGYEPPENAAADEVHYLMQPYHALELAHAAEARAERFFAKLASAATTAAVRRAARALQAEEREHVRLVREWMKKVPKPDAEWADDPDPPVYIE